MATSNNLDLALGSRAATLLSLVVLLGAQALAQAQTAILITVDTLRADHVECYGYPVVATPALNQLSADGIRFTNAFTASPVTNVSHASILTGTYPTTHGVKEFGTRLSSAHITLATLLKQNGFQTAAFIGSIVLDSATLAPGFDRGFDFFYHFKRRSANSSRYERLERRALDVINDAEKWISAHPDGKRFVWIHLYDPHDPYEAPGEFSRRYHDRPYDGEVAYTDFAIQHLLAFLVKSALYEDALLAVVADHGEGLGDHGEETHGLFLYDATLHVPMILKLPRQIGVTRRTIEQQVRTIDLMPTLLSFLAVRPPPEIDGRSLADLILKGLASEASAVAHTDYPARFGWAPLTAVRTEGFKFVDAPRPELYDLQSDPGELHNIYESWDPHVQTSRAELAKLDREASRNGPEASTARPSVGKATVDELKALGYLGEGLKPANAIARSTLPDPKDKIEVQNLVHQALLLREKGKSEQARALLKRALKLDPHSKIIKKLLARVAATAFGAPSIPNQFHDDGAGEPLVQANRSPATSGLAYPMAFQCRRCSGW